MHLKDPVADARLQQDGYVVLDLLGAADVDALRRGFDALDLPSQAGFSATLGRLDDAANQQASEVIVSVIGPRLDEVLDGYRAIGSTYLVKEAGGEGEMDLHQDWSSVDESVARSANVWCPLVATGPDNGRLLVVPGSHGWFDAARSPFLPSVNVPLDQAGGDAMVPLDLRPGQVVLYDHALFHGSGENRTGEPRVIAQVGIAPADVPLCMAVPTADGVASLRKVEPEAFFRGLAFEQEGGDLSAHPEVGTAPAGPVTVAQVLEHLAGGPAGAAPSAPSGTAAATEAPRAGRSRSMPRWLRRRAR
ncbi:MAG: phytanoyl-CoA dioxygenase family protein [Acidimicrobiales bacterium]